MSNNQAESIDVTQARPGKTITITESGVYVVRNQPSNAQHVIQQNTFARPGKRDWSNGLCGCFSNCKGVLCCLFCTPCYTCHVYSKAGEGCCDCLVGGLVPLRVKVRTERGIKGSICGDVCTSAFCGCCALIQIESEIDSTPPLI